MPQSVISQKLGTQRNGGLSLRLCMAFLLTFTALLLSVGGLQPVYAQAPPGPAGAPPVAPEATPAPAAPAAAAPAAPSQSDISGGYAGLGAAGDVADAAGNIAPTEPTDKAAKDYADKKKTYDDFQGMMTKEPLAARMADGIGQNRIGINIMWTLVTGYLVMFMQAGFAMVESGFCRAKHAAHVFMTNFLIYPIGMLGFWLCGFAFMFGSVGAIGNLGLGADVLNGGNSFIGWKGFMLGLGPGGIAPELYNPAVYTLFLFQMVFMDTTCTIPTGAMAERWKFSAFIIYGFFISTIIYPIYGHWVWGGGWLSALGTNYGLGHGAVDFAGSGVVHAVGGWVALAGAMVLGPRLGKYTDRTASPALCPVTISRWPLSGRSSSPSAGSASTPAPRLALPAAAIFASVLWRPTPCSLRRAARLPRCFTGRRNLAIPIRAWSPTASSPVW